METIFFFLFAGVSVLAAVAMVLFRNPIYSALSLVTTFFCLAGLFVLLNASFLAAVQVIVYAGAIMVLFLFVIMLLNLGHADSLEPVPGKFKRGFVIVLMVLLLAQLGVVAGGQLGSSSQSDGELLTNNIPYIGKMLYTDFLFPFEIAGMILLVALIGVVVLVKRDAPEADSQEASQVEAAS